MPDMKLSDLADGLADMAPETAAIPVAGMTADSRKVEPGFLFAALSGTRLDGSVFLAEARRKGAAAVLVEGDVHVADGLPVLRAADCL